MLKKQEADQGNDNGDIKVERNRRWKHSLKKTLIIEKPAAWLLRSLRVPCKEFYLDYLIGTAIMINEGQGWRQNYSSLDDKIGVQAK